MAILNFNCVSAVEKITLQNAGLEVALHAESETNNSDCSLSFIKPVLFL